MANRDWKIVEIFYSIRNLLRGKKPWPDFTKHTIEISNYNFEQSDGSLTEEKHGFFPDIPPNVAAREGWLKYEEYTMLADLEFARRYPEHELSIGILKKLKQPIMAVEEFVATGMVSVPDPAIKDEK